MGFVVFLLYLGLNSWLFIYPFFLENRADMSGFFTLQPLIFSILIPAITMGLFASEFRSGHWEVLFSLPMKTRDLLLGKYFSGLAILGILLLPTLSYPIGIALLGQMEWGPVFAGYTGILLMAGSLSAVGLFFSYAAKNQLTAFLCSFGTSIFLSAVDDMSLILSNRFSGGLSGIGIDLHILPFTQGLVTLKDIVYFLTITFFFLMMTAENLGRRKKNFILRARMPLYFILLILVNTAVNPLPLQLDFTAQKKHSLSQASVQTVQALQEPLTAHIYLSRNLPGSHGTLKENLIMLMESYRIRSRGKFLYQVHLLDSVDEQLQEQALDYGITPQTLQSYQSGQMELTKVWAGIVLLQGPRELALPVLGPTDNLEYRITGGMEKLLRQTRQLSTLEDDISITLEITGSLLSLGSEFQNYPILLEQEIEAINPLYLNRLAYSVSVSESESLRAGLTVKGNERSYTRDLTRAVEGNLTLVSPEETAELIRQIISLLLGTGNSMAYLIDHGTTPLYGEGGVNNFSRLVSGRYDIRPVTLRGIPQNVKTLILNNPTERFTSGEQEILAEFIHNGGSLALFMSSYQEIFPSEEELAQGELPRYVKDDTGLNAFLARYGLGLEPAYILDSECYTEFLQEESGSITEVPVYYAPLIKRKYINQDIKEIASLKEFLAVQISPVVMLNREDERVTPLFFSSESSWLMSENLNLFDPLSITPPTRENRGSYLMGALASAPGTGGNVLLIGSARFLDDMLIDPEGQTPNAVLALNLLDKLAGNTEIALLRSKGMSYNPLGETSEFQRNLFILFPMYILPVIVLAFLTAGLFRNKRRIRQIEHDFSQEKRS